MRRTAGLAVGAVILLAAAAGTGLASHRAFVKLSVPAQKVEVGLTLTGSHGSGDLPTQNLTVKVADTLAGSASMATINTYASGDVVFAWPCSPGSCPWAIRVYAGSDLWTRGGIHYQTLADVLWVPPAQSQPTPIRAVMPGPSGNTGPGTVVGLGSVWGNIGVTNPKAITGGSSREAHIISESDFSAVERAVLTEAINDANQAMRVKAAGMGYALIGGPSIIETSSDAVGDETQTFTITITASMNAVGFSDIAARALIRKAVLARVRSDQQLTPDSIETDYKIDKLTPEGGVTVTADGVGFVIPKVATRWLQSRIATMDLVRARVELKHDVPGAAVQIQVWPDGITRLPAIAGNIAFQIEVLPAPA